MKKHKNTSTETVRQFGQSSLTSSFLSKSRVTNVGTQEKPTKKSISLSDFLTRKIGHNNGKVVKEKRSSFASIGIEKKNLAREKDDVGSGFVLDRSVFQRFNQPMRKESSEVEEVKSDDNGDGECSSSSRKRKSPFGVSSGDDKNPQATKYLVLGDDPKPKPTRRVRKLVDKRAKPFYNHYENGGGWWDGNREGVDSEEVGHNEVWEGMGSTTLGGLEWH